MCCNKMEIAQRNVVQNQKEFFQVSTHIQVAGKLMSVLCFWSGLVFNFFTCLFGSSVRAVFKT